jgi:ribonuclease-3
LALTHASVASQSNQRLEFLGDAILSSVISQMLYQHSETLDEGRMTQLRAWLVCRQTLQQLSKVLNLQDYVQIGKSLAAAKAVSENIYADAFEALVGAIYLDSDFEQARRVVVCLYQKIYGEQLLSKIQKDAKTRLQEFCQSNKYVLPQYDVAAYILKDAPGFLAVANLVELSLRAEAFASTKRDAQQQAAGKICQQLQKKGLLKDE